MSSTGPDGIGPADWDRADWAALARELDEVARLAGRLRLWTVAGLGRPVRSGDARPGRRRRHHEHGLACQEMASHRS
jgi:hypothetical protein